MKYLIGLIAFAAIISFRYVEEIYNIPVKTIDGAKLDLNQCRGKKILFIVLPVTTSDTTVSFGEITQLQARYQNSLVVIGVPAEETGVKKGDEGKIKKMYKDASANFIITERMKVKKGAEQSAIFQWLTDKDKNRHYNEEVAGVGTKFFLDEGGELYAVMRPQLKLSNPMIDRILSKKNPAEK